MDTSQVRRYPIPKTCALGICSLQYSMAILPKCDDILSPLALPMRVRLIMLPAVPPINWGRTRKGRAGLVSTYLARRPRAFVTRATTACHILSRKFEQTACLIFVTFTRSFHARLSAVRSHRSAASRPKAWWRKEDFHSSKITTFFQNLVNKISTNRFTMKPYNR